MSERVRPQPGRVPQRKRAPRFAGLFQTGGVDVAFTCLVMILFAIGVTMMYSASYPYASAYSKNGPNVYFYNQLIFGLLGFVAMAIISKLDYRILNSFLTPLAFLATVFLLIFTYAWNVLKHNEIKR